MLTEPVLHLTEKKDSLDLMNEMKMSTLLQHPVVMEVINLINEGQYSISSDTFSMSYTYQV